MTDLLQVTVKAMSELGEISQNIQNFKKYHMVTGIIGGPYLYLTNLVGFIIIQIDW